MAVGWMPGVKRKWRLVRGRVAFARGGGGESRRENEDEEGATYPSLLEESCLRFKNLVEVDARARVCARLFRLQSKPMIGRFGRSRELSL